MARPRQVTDEQILAAARACFLEHGAAVSTTVIADKVGLSQPALFRRFGTKERLLIAAMRPPTEGFDGLFEADPDPDGLMDQLRTIAQRIQAFSTEFVPCMAVLREAGITPVQLSKPGELPSPVRIQQAAAGWIRRAQQRGLMRATNADAAAMALLGAIQARAFMQHAAAGGVSFGDPDEYLDGLVELLWNGLAPEVNP